MPETSNASERGIGRLNIVTGEDLKQIGNYERKRLNRERKAVRIK